MDTQNNSQQEEQQQNYDDENQNQTNRAQAKYKGQIEASGIEQIQEEIQAVTKKIEHEKINLRICNERYEKKYVAYCELQGRPVPLTKEQKELAKRDAKKERKNHKVSDPIPKKVIKEHEFEENRNKTLRSLKRNQNEIELLTNDINEIQLNIEDLKQQVALYRKQKGNLANELKQVKKHNEQRKKDIQNMQKKNQNHRKEIKYKELRTTQNIGVAQEKEFNESRDDKEKEYHKIIEENIRREREDKKEKAKKRQMLAAIADSKSGFKGSNRAELEKQIKMMQAEEISDRAPIIDKLLEKWKYVNVVKKHMIEKYQQNANSIAHAFDEVMRFLGLDDLADLPIVYRKAEDQMANIEMVVSNLESDVDNLTVEKAVLNEKIEFLKEKIKTNDLNKSSFIEDKQSKIAILSAEIERIQKDILQKRNLFKKLQPDTDNYLTKLGETYLADYIHDKCYIDDTTVYNEKSIMSYLTNVEDYYELIQMFELAVKDRREGTKNYELELLRKDIKYKLENFNKNKVINKDLYTTMKSEAKLGNDFDEIIKKSSFTILNQLTGSSPISTIDSVRKKGVQIQPLPA